MATSFRSVGTFDPHDLSAPIEWESWKAQLKNFITAAGITSDARKRATLLNEGGKELTEVVGGLEEPGNTFEETIKALDAYFRPRINPVYEAHILLSQVQKEDESIDAFVGRLRNRAKNCIFSQENFVIAIIARGCQNPKLREKILGESNLTMEKVMKIARDIESAKKKEESFKVVRPNAEDINKNYSVIQQIKEKCDRCGLSGHKPANCDAIGQYCTYCGIEGHFARVCHRRGKIRGRGTWPRRHTRRPYRAPYQRHARTWSERNVNRVEEGEGKIQANSLDEALDIFSVDSNGKDASTNVKVNGINIQMIVDTGARHSTITEKDFNKVNWKKDIKITPVDRYLTAYTGDAVPLVGKVQLKMEANGVSLIEPVFIVKGPTASLISKNASEALKFVILNLNQINDNCDPLQLQKYFPNCFNGVGKLKNVELRIHLKPDAIPVAQKPRRLPFKLREHVEKEVQRLLTNDIIEKVTGPTSWLNPVCPVIKQNGRVRLCLDMRRTNESILRTNYNLPTLDEVISEMDGAKFISKVDLKEGFHQIALDDASRSITAFSTESGVYRYKRLFFGVSSAPEVFQHLIQQSITGLPGVKNIQDDIIIYGRTKEIHDQRLIKLMKRLSMNGLTVNPDKCVFRSAQITFMGHELNSNGVAPAKDKIESINNMKSPESPTEIRSFLGLVGFCSKFINNFATKTERLRALTRSNSEWEWNEHHEKAFKQLKDDITRATTLAYYQRDYTTILTVDASPVGLGAILSQIQPNGARRPIAMASRLLSQVERRYSQTEKEALAVVWSCEHFRLYLIGSTFTIESDHKPLEILYAPRSRPSARIERWVLRLQQFNYKMRYIKGKNNSADSLSRLTKHESTESQDEEDSINRVVEYALPNAITLEQITQQTDEQYIQLREAIMRGRENEAPEEFRKIFRELTTINGIIMRSDRIFIPKALRPEVLKIAHSGHQGIVRTKQRLRSKVWWNNMDKETEEMIHKCLACSVTKHVNKPIQTTPTPLPSGPWQHVAIDICGPFPDGHHVLIMADYYSRWPEAKVTKDITSSGIINWLNDVFSRFGYPNKLTSDNGRQFVSREFEEYLAQKDIKHIRTPPYWPRANGMVERLNRSFQEAIEAIKFDTKQSWQKGIVPFLFAYRNTQHRATGRTPAELMLGRSTQCGLPGIPINTNEPDVIAKDNIYKRKYTTKQAEHNIKTGDKVLTKRLTGVTKLKTRYHPEVGTVINTRKSEIEIEMPDGNVVKRHPQHTKIIKQ